MVLSSERLREIVTELISRPRHEKVRILVYELLLNGFGAKPIPLWRICLTSCFLRVR